ncbi:hypothetical protein FOCC_FOCC015109 [Frankliniella occidentalis]|nr:hypothetical protein FOCC_FOCC015109 [Frankliniella occidentalis]
MPNQLQYANVNKLKKKVKRDISRSLEGDTEEWSAISDSCHTVGARASPQGLDSEKREDGASCGKIHSTGEQRRSPICNVFPPLASNDTLFESSANVGSGVDTAPEVLCEAADGPILNLSASCSGSEEGSECVWNLSFLEEPHAVTDGFCKSSDSETGTQSLDHRVSLRFDCDLCINCSCGVCSDCVHTDGESCQHCDYCRSGNDSEAELECDHWDSDGEVENFDVDPFEELSDVQKANERIKNEFTDIVLEHNASHALIKQMLVFFRRNNFGDFPKCPSTLLKTPVVTKVRAVPPGEYWHRGLESDLLLYAKTSDCSIIKVTFSVDGVPMMASSGAEFYPICCTFNDSKDVVLAGVYYGVGKPNSSDDFLKDFVDEMNPLVEKGIECEGRHVCVEVHLAICDAVAKSWLLNVKGHGGYYGCCKCTVEGVWLNGRVAFHKLNCTKRTDESFNLQLQEEHHNGTTILSSLKSFKPVTNVVLDYMHLCLLGTMRKMVYMMLAGPKSVRQSASTVIKMSSILESLAAWIPSDFARKCRSLKYVKKFKATEWRLILYYVGVVLFEATLPKHLYEHFLVLFVAMTILTSEVHLQNHIDYAHELMSYFIQTFIELYGKKYASHNIHNLIHLVDDCRVHGSVDKFSAFVFENFYQKLKKMIRKGDKPLQQLCRRYEEQKLKKQASIKKPTVGLQFSGVHNDGPLPPWCANPQYLRMQSGSEHKLSLSQANNCCCLIDGSKYVLVNFSDGPFIVQGSWITEDMKFAALPPNFSQFTGLEYDKFIQSAEMKPEDGWMVFHLLRIRAYSDEFSKVRLKLKTAEICSETDLNSSPDHTHHDKTVGRNLRHRVRKVGSQNEQPSSDDESPNLKDKSKIPPPAPPKSTLTLGSYKEFQIDKAKSEKQAIKIDLSEKKTRNLKSPDPAVASSSTIMNKMDSAKSKMEASQSSIKTDVSEKDTPNHISPDPVVPSSSTIMNKMDSAKSKMQASQSSVKTDLSELDTLNHISPDPVVPSSATIKVDSAKSKIQASQSSVKTDLSEKDTLNQNSPDRVVPSSSTTLKESDGSNKKTDKQAAIELAQKLTDDGYVILNLTEQRSQFKQILHELAKMSLNPREVREVSSSRPPALDASFTKSEENDVLYGCPHIDADSWTNFNAKLKSDSIYAVAVADKLNDIAANESDLGEYVRTILGKIITNALASEYSWAGRLDNKPFHDLFVVKMIKWMVKKFTKYPRVKDDIKVIIQHWLRLAPQRSGGKNFQKYKAKSSPNTQEGDGEELAVGGTTRATRTPASSTPKKNKKKPAAFKVSHSPIMSPAKKKQRRQICSDSDSDLDAHMSASVPKTHEGDEGELAVGRSTGAIPKHASSTSKRSQKQSVFLKFSTSPLKSPAKKKSKNQQFYSQFDRDLDAHMNHSVPNTREGPEVEGDGLVLKAKKKLPFSLASPYKPPAKNTYMQRQSSGSGSDLDAPEYISDSPVKIKSVRRRRKRVLLPIVKQEPDCSLQIVDAVDDSADSFGDNNAASERDEALSGSANKDRF